MSEPRIDPDLRIGRFLLSDLMRSLGDFQWFLTNISTQTQMGEPLLAEIMANLAHAGAVRLQVWPDKGAVVYEQFGKGLPGLCRSRLRKDLTRLEAEGLIQAVCRRAASLNADPGRKFTYEKIYLFGSCLTDKPNPADVDLAMEIHYHDGAEIPEPTYVPFQTKETFDIASGHLRGKGERSKLGLHDPRELHGLKAPYRLIWRRDCGPVNGHLMRPLRSPAIVKHEADTRSAYQAQQKALDAFVTKVKGVREWPQPPYPGVGWGAGHLAGALVEVARRPLGRGLRSPHVFARGSLA